MRTTEDYTKFKRRSAAIARQQKVLDVLRAEYDLERREIFTRLGIDELWPDELPPQLNCYDVLDQIEVRDGHWIWTGRVNNKQSPVSVFYLGSEAGTSTFRSAAGIVHRLITGEHHHKAYFYRCGEPHCVLPAHRCRICESS